jgi:TRAP-type mannitol/chloroaromatic compound transport system permease large subunit
MYTQGRMDNGYASYITIVRVVFVVIGLGMIALNSWFLYYVDQLERSGCKCAMGWRRSVMEAALALFVLAALVGLFVNWQTHFPLLALLYMSIVLTYIFVARNFIMEIKETHCDCAQSDAFKVLNVVNWIQLFFVAVLVLTLLLKMAFLMTVGRAALARPVGRLSSR